MVSILSVKDCNSDLVRGYDMRICNYLSLLIAEKEITVEKAKVIIDQQRTYKCKSLEEVVEMVKKLPKSNNLKLNVNYGSGDNHSTERERFSPSGGRANGSPFQQVPTSITQNLKNKTMKSPTPIMAGSKREAERQHDQNGKGERTLLITFSSFLYLLCISLRPLVLKLGTLFI